MACHNAVKHKVIGNFVTACFNHCNQIFGGRNGKGKVGLFSFFQSRVDNDFAVNKTNKSGSDRTIPRNIGNGDCRRNTDSGGDFRRAVGVNRHNGCNNRTIVAHILREKRADGAVDTAGSQNGLFACFTLAALERAGDTTYRIKFFFIVNRKGEEINPFARLVRSRNGAENACFAIGCHKGSVCKPCHHAGFKFKRSAGNGCFINLVVFKHNFSPFFIFGELLCF